MNFQNSRLPLIEPHPGAVLPRIVKRLQIRQQCVKRLLPFALPLLPLDRVVGGQSFPASDETLGNQLLLPKRVEHIVNRRVFVTGRLGKFDGRRRTKLQQRQINIGLPSVQTEFLKLFQTIHSAPSLRCRKIPIYHYHSSIAEKSKIPV